MQRALNDLITINGFVMTLTQIKKMKVNINVKIKNGPISIISNAVVMFSDPLLVVDYLDDDGVPTQKVYHHDKIEAFNVSFIED